MNLNDIGFFFLFLFTEKRVSRVEYFMGKGNLDELHM